MHPRHWHFWASCLAFSPGKLVFVLIPSGQDKMTRVHILTFICKKLYFNSDVVNWWYINRMSTAVGAGVIHLTIIVQYFVSVRLQTLYYFFHVSFRWLPTKWWLIISSVSVSMIFSIQHLSFVHQENSPQTLILLSQLFFFFTWQTSIGASFWVA
jgi:hypothetical protein